MPASYPTSAKTFTTKSDGAGNTIQAAHINDLQLEVTAIEQDLIAGLPMSRGGTGLTAALAANRIPYSNGTALTSAATFTFDGTTFTAPATTITQPLTISGASAGQIVFPASQNASAGANTLDDYEEGTFVPAVAFGGGTTGLTYSAQQGAYVKIGLLVFLTLRITLTSKGSSTGAATVTGLPFTVDGTYYGMVTAPYAIGMGSLTAGLVGYCNTGNTTITLGAPNTSGVSGVTDANFTNTTDIILVGAYRANG